MATRRTVTGNRGAHHRTEGPSGSTWPSAPAGPRVGSSSRRSRPARGRSGPDRPRQRRLSRQRRHPRLAVATSVTLPRAATGFSRPMNERPPSSAGAGQSLVPGESPRTGAGVLERLLLRTAARRPRTGSLDRHSVAVGYVMLAAVAAICLPPAVIGWAAFRYRPEASGVRAGGSHLPGVGRGDRRRHRRRRAHRRRPVGRLLGHVDADPVRHPDRRGPGNPPRAAGSGTITRGDDEVPSAGAADYRCSRECRDRHRFWPDAAMEEATSRSRIDQGKEKGQPSPLSTTGGRRHREVTNTPGPESGR